MAVIHIHKATSEEFNGWSASDREDVDEAKSLAALDEQTVAAVKAAIPSADVDLIDGNGVDSFTVYPANQDIDNRVQMCIEDVYGAWQWLRDSDGKVVQA
jgi:hypothetical protein